ncbi:hypothetical protein IJH33_00335 [Candidatus Saccharibacteria bacterium]|nr:hypothetical protein [Candidatus Saccharibacteria bacterium]
MSEFDGNPTYGKKTACAGFYYGYQRLCGTPAGSAGGGASWRIYSTSDSSGPGYVESKNLWGGNGVPSVTLSTVQASCPASKYQWYAAYGWEGSTAKGKGKQWGIAQYGTGVIASAVYNDYGGVSLESAITAIMSGSVSSGMKLSSTADALALAGIVSGYERKAFNATTGFFCIAQDAFLDKPNSDNAGGGGGGGTDNPDDSRLCETWKPSSYQDSGSEGGTTSVAEGVINQRLRQYGSGTYKKWQWSVNGTRTTYAMPTDTVKWQGCYYPGVQRVDRNRAVVTVGGSVSWNGHEGHHDQDSCDVTHNDTTTVVSLLGGEGNDSGWQNKYILSKWNGGLVYSSNSFTLPTSPKEFLIGDSAVKTWDKTQELEISYVDGGRSYGIEMKTGRPVAMSLGNEGTHPRDCDFHCECGCDDDDDDDSSSDSGSGEGGGSTCVDPMDCPCGTTSDDRDRTTASVSSGPVSVKARVNVPYNFVNIAGVEIEDKDDDEDDVIYSGNTVRISTAWVDTNVRYNSITEAAYATQVDNARVQLVAYVSASDTGSSFITSSSGCGAVGGNDGGYKYQCKEVSSWQGTLNNYSNNVNRLLYGDSREMKNDLGVEYNAFDASAGDFMCFRLGVYPATSGNDTNMSASGDGRWYFSAPSCKVIAKRPNFQVYGGSLYSSGNIVTSVSTKRNLWEVYDYIASGISNQTLFGSWVEQAVVANGLVRNLASGAAFGYSTSAAKSGFRGSSSEYCEKLVPLSFANYSTQIFANSLCPGGAGMTGKANIQSNAVGGKLDKSALVDYWATGGTNVNGGASVNLRYASQYTVLSSASGAKVRYTRSNGDMTLQGTTIDRGVTHIVVARDANGKAQNVRIDGNIQYPDVGSTVYGKASELPQIVIYGNNITISCGVTTIDAIIIAEGNVNTCPDYGDNINASERSVQLNIRGVVVANSMSLNRTYGNAWGEQSNVPAETINYDSSMILWSRYMAGSGESDTLTTVYQHETAPRY